jgi:Flp pilus assembly protein TadG
MFGSIGASPFPAKKVSHVSRSEHMAIRSRQHTQTAPPHGNRRGATTVEFALTAPIFFLFLLAAFEFGWMNVIRHTADNAAYEAARTIIVPGATATEARNKANSLLNIVGARGATVTVTPSTVTTETEAVTVAIDVPMSSHGLIVPRFTKNSTVHSESTLRTERAK